MNINLCKSALTKAVILSGAVLAACGVKEPVRGAPAEPLSPSSYFCYPVAIKGLPVTGVGPFGCHFVLHGTHAPGETLANTPYRLEALDKDGKTLVAQDGVTDAKGRSGFLRTEFQLTPDRMMFVQAIGAGAIGASSLAAYPGGQRMAGNPFSANVCGVVHEGNTDEQGFTPWFKGAVDCVVDTQLYSR
jgi:hypothetical protein